MFDSQMGHMEKAGLPQRIPFYRPNRLFVTQMAGTDGQPIQPPHTMGNGAQPIGLRGKIPQRQRKSTRRHLVSPANTDQ